MKRPARKADVEKADVSSETDVLSRYLLGISSVGQYDDAFRIGLKIDYSRIPRLQGEDRFDLDGRSGTHPAITRVANQIGAALNVSSRGYFYGNFDHGGRGYSETHGSGELGAFVELEVPNEKVVEVMSTILSTMVERTKSKNK